MKRDAGAIRNPMARVAVQSHSPFFQYWCTPLATAMLNAAMLSRIESMAQVVMRADCDTE
eukprot:4651309-Pleurochrysis_carterae.AAC.1